MKIAFDHQIFNDQIYGGISRYFATLGEEFLNKGQDVKIYAGVHRNKYLGKFPAGVVSGIEVNDYPRKTGRVIQKINHLYGQFRMNNWQPDVIHETYYSSMPVLRCNAVRITSVYDMIHELYASEFSSRDNTTKRKRKTFERVDHIISISHSTKKDLIELFDVEESKISVVHLGVDLAGFKKPVIDTTFSGMPYILYVGSRWGYKNFDGFMKACATSGIIKNKIKIVAFGGGKFSNDELLMMENLGFKPGFVEQLGGGDDTLSMLYTNALCFVYPSLYEGFGLPPLEAMAAKCPVVVSNTSSIPEVVNQAGVYFDPTSIDDMSYAIESVILDESVRSKLIKLGLENIKQFSWEHCANDTLDIYKNLTGKK